MIFVATSVPTGSPQMAVCFEIGPCIPNALRAIDDEVDAYSRRPGTHLERILARALRTSGADPDALVADIKTRSLQVLGAALRATGTFLGIKPVTVALGGRRL